MAKKKAKKKASAKAAKSTKKVKTAPPKKRKAKTSTKRPIEQYDHIAQKRPNNPPVGLVTPDTDPDGVRKTYAYDPHLDPQLVWAGKAEHTSFEVPTVSLHVHERIDPKSIIQAVRKINGDGNGHGANGGGKQQQAFLFEQPEENPPIRDAVEFYQHEHNWSNRLVAGDSLLVMNSLLEKEGMAGKVQMVYLDPPYGIRYGSNFQPFVNQKNVPRTDRDQDLSSEPEMLRAFRDTWELGIHSYLTYLRDRLLLSRDLLSPKGSCFVQISDENVHLVRQVMDEVFGPDNFVVTIFYRKKGSQRGNDVKPINDHILWYCRDKSQRKLHLLYDRKMDAEDLSDEFEQIEFADGSTRPTSSLTNAQLKDALENGARLYVPEPLTSGGEYRTQLYSVNVEGRVFRPPSNNCWKFNEEGMQRIIAANRIHVGRNQIRFKKYHTDFPYRVLSNLWDDIAGAYGKIYVVQTAEKAVQRCMLMTTDPGDLVFDPTCGSGTTAFVAEQWGRRWIACDSSRIALTLAKQRLLTTTYDYWKLAHPDEGLASGFVYAAADRTTSTTVANDLAPEHQDFYDCPIPDVSKARVTGPFTVEAVPAAAVKPLDDVGPLKALDVDAQPTLPGVGPLDGQRRLETAVARSGETVRQAEWRDELLKTGIRGRGGQRIEFSRVEVLGGTRWLHANAETRGDAVDRAVISFGPEHAPLEQKQVARALEEAETLRPKPKLIIFAAFQFDPEAAKDIDETNWPGVTLLKVQMNADMLTDDLKKKRTTNDSYWLIGQPDVELVREGNEYRVAIHGFDYYNTRTGTIESGDTTKIAMWLLDTDYDGRSLYPRQVFFPMAGEKDGWARLAKNLKAEIDEDLIEQYRGAHSLPFAAGEHARIAVKIVDDRGIESLRVVPLN